MVAKSIDKILWYSNRLSTMSLREIVTMRLFRAIRDRVVPIKTNAPTNLSLQLNPVRELDWDGFDILSAKQESELIREANDALKNNFIIFGQRFEFGNQINWNQDYITGKEWPLVPIKDLDYRDGVGGDPKDIWELNRHGFLLTLARAYQVTKETKYAEKIVEIIKSWLDSCPPYQGINWTSCIEFSIRQISWLWSLRLIAETDILDQNFMQRVAKAMYLQTHYIQKHLSLYSSANNHLVSELCILVMIGKCLGIEKWVDTGKNYLFEYLNSQILEDGTGAEQAPNYLAHTMEFYALALLELDQEVPSSVRKRLLAGCDFLRSMLGKTEVTGTFGDNDSGHILPLNTDYCEHRALLNLMAVVLDEPSLFEPTCDRDDKLFFLLGKSSFTAAKNQAGSTTPRALPISFPAGGYYILQNQWGPNEIRVLFDCGHLGLPPLAAHGHMDALSLILEINGEAVLVDPGTYTYFKDLEWRDYFRSTRAHNSITVDAQEQSIPGGRFLYKYQAQAECLGFRKDQEVIGRHHGYSRLQDPVSHTRHIVLNSQLQEIQIHDSLTGKSSHLLSQFFHFHPDCRVERSGLNRYEGHRSDGPRVEFHLDSQASWNLVHGREDNILGWYSNQYNQKVPTACIEGEMQFEGVATLTTRIRIGEK